VGKGIGEEAFTQSGQVGPLFLFFGWFSMTEGAGDARQFVQPRKNHDVHSFFGWLQAAQKVNFSSRSERASGCETRGRHRIPMLRARTLTAPTMRFTSHPAKIQKLINSSSKANQRA
jgi:hypothetical protein